jgi:hypothetical protein
VISTELARALRAAGLVWKPQPGDRFVLDRSEFDADVFTVSDMTIEAHVYPTGTVLGFNGTTEWALDSVALADAVWMPHEHQMRDLLRTGFRSLELDGDGLYRVTAVVGGEERVFEQVSAAEAYGQALLALIRLTH